VAKKEQSIFDNKEFPFGRHLNAVTKLYVGALRKHFEYLDIERHYSILIAIEKSPNLCTQQYIADYLQKDKTTMVGIVDDLSKRGYIKRVNNPLDRRQHLLELTPKALKALPEIHKGIDTLNKKATRGLKKEEVKKLLQYLELIHTNLSKEPAYDIVSNFEKANQE